MSNSIRLKRSSIPAKIPLASDLTDGELALNSADGRIYYRHNSGNVSEIKASEVTNGVYTVGDQPIAGVKTFSNNIIGNGDIEVTNNVNGVILKSPNGTRFRITVGNDGALTTTLVV